MATEHQRSESAGDATHPAPVTDGGQTMGANADSRRSMVAIARLDHRDARQSRLIRYLLYFFVLVCLIGGYAFPAVTSGDVTGDRFAGFMSTSIGLLLPLVGLLLGYNAVVGDRESGRLKLSLSMPHSRRDVLAGKLLTRGGYLVAAVLIGLIGAGALVYYPFGSLSVSYLAYMAVTLGFGIIFFGIGVTLSTFLKSRQFATVGAFGIFFLFVVIWEELLSVVVFLLEQVGGSGEPTDPLRFIHGAEPGLLYDRIIGAFFEGRSEGPYLGADAPWYLGEGVALFLFALWVVVPLAVGYLRFTRTDL